MFETNLKNGMTGGSYTVPQYPKPEARCLCGEPINTAVSGETVTEDGTRLRFVKCSKCGVVLPVKIVAPE